MWFCNKNDLFYQAGLKSENGNQLGSILHVNKNEPKKKKKKKKKNGNHMKPSKNVIL